MKLEISTSPIVDPGLIFVNDRDDCTTLMILTEGDAKHLASALQKAAESLTPKSATFMFTTEYQEK